jgi:peroxisomal enoyl-CoA hydratase 2
MNVQVTWNQRDLLLYALGIGAKKEDFGLVYGTSVLPFHANPILTVM